MNKIIVCYLFFFASCSSNKTPKIVHSINGMDKIENWETIKNRFHFKTNKLAYCFIAFDQDCPLCKYYSSVVNQLADSFYKQGIQFLIVYPDAQLNEKKPSYFSTSRTIHQVFDLGNQLITELEFTTTPEVVLVSQHANIVYRGKIDDRAIGIGKHKLVADTFYLKNALVNICNGINLKQEYTTPTGCYIEKK